MKEDVIYIGLITHTKGSEDKPIKVLYPEGQVAIVNDGTNIGAYVAGRTEGALPVDGYKIFTTVQDAFAWVVEK